MVIHLETHMFCIVLADRPHGSCKCSACRCINALFWNLVSGWKNPKTLAFCSRVDSKSAYFAANDAIPHLSTSSLQPLNPAPSHNNNNNNNGGLACVCATKDIGPIMVTRAKYYAALPLDWVNDRLAIFIFFRFCLLFWNRVGCECVMLWAFMAAAGRCVDSK